MVNKVKTQEVTDAMIEAGAAVLRRPWVAIDLAEGFQSPEELAEEVYRAMQNAKLPVDSKNRLVIQG